MVKITTKSRTLNASFFNGVARAAERSIVDGLLRRLERAGTGLLHRFFSRSLAYVAAGAFVVVGIVFLLVGAVEGLKSARLPDGWAYGAPGAAALVGGYILVRVLGARRES
jgi:hypothetical protein